MKRYPLVLAGIFCPLLFALRLMQMYFCIDAEGFFLRDTTGQVLLAYSLYILLFVAGALLLLICLPRFTYGSVSHSDFLQRKMCRVTCFLLAAAILAEGSVRLYNCMVSLTFDWVVPFALLGAIGCMMLGSSAWGKLWWGALLPIAYAGVRVAAYFFASFKYIRASETIFDVLQMALMVLLFLEIARQLLGIDPVGGRLRFLSIGYIFLITITVLARAVALALGVTAPVDAVTYVTMAVDFLVGILAAMLFAAVPIGGRHHTEDMDN